MALSLEEKEDFDPPRITIYGPPKIGKSTFASMAPSPVFIQTEDGLTALDVPHYPLAKSFKEVMKYLEEIATEEHEFKTLVIDSLDWMEKLIHKQICEENGVTSLENLNWGKGYVAAFMLWEQYIDAVNYIRLNRNMCIIQIAHSEIKRHEDPETEGYDKYQIKLHKTASASITEKSDMILFVNYVVSVIKTQEGFNKKTRAIGDGEAMLYTMNRPQAVAGNRYSMPPEIPFTRDGSYWATIAQYVPYFSKMMGN